MFLRFLQDEAGATAVEYSLLAALLAVVCIAAMRALGGKMDSTYSSIANSLPG